MRNMKTNALKKKIQNTIVYKKVKSWIVSKLYIFPVQNNKIIFDNFGGRGFGDDPKYIAEELLQRNLGLKIIWVTAIPNISVPSGIQIVKYGTIRAAYHWITGRERDNIIFKRGIQHLGSRKTRKMRRTYQYVISSRQRQTENKST